MPKTFKHIDGERCYLCNNFYPLISLKEVVWETREYELVCPECYLELEEKYREEIIGSDDSFPIPFMV